MKSIKLVVDAVNIVLMNLAQGPEHPEVHKLREKAVAYAKEAEGWKDHPPPGENREALMKKVLGLHTAVSAYSGRTWARVPA